MDATTPTPRSFGQEHFGDAYLGDQRRTRSLVDVADRLARHPGGSLPLKFKDPLALRRCYDLMKCPQVTHARVLQPHVQRTLNRVQQCPGTVLILHDGTELDFTDNTALHPYLGQIGKGSRKGYLCLNSLAVLPGAQRTVLGLVSQLLHVRPHVPKDESRQQKRQREDRESLLWLQAVDQVETATVLAQRRGLLAEPAAGQRIVDVVDRGGDTFEFMDHEEQRDRKFVVRSQHNRTIHLSTADGVQPRRLHDYLRGLPSQGQRLIELSDRPERPARQALVQVAWATVQVQAPSKPRGQHRPDPLTLTALRVWEAEPPPGVEAVDWFLLSNLPVQTLEQAWEVVDYYCSRWLIEEFHKAQKTGCAIEEPQLTTPARIQPLVALLSVVATLLLDLRALSRDPQTAECPATDKVDAEYVEVLSGWRYGERRPLSVRAFFLALARLGGHQNRRGDKPPGWLVLWRGWTALQLLVAGARAVRCPAGPDPPPPPPASASGR
jgi:Transposase DNA-binding